MHTTEDFTFTGAGGHTLVGKLEMPRYGKPRACAIFAHCFTCGKDSKAATTITRKLAQEGFAVLRFDFAGLGESEGDFSSFASQVEDLQAAAAAMREKGSEPSLLIGHSLGGAAVIAAAPEIDSVCAIATLGAPSDTDHVLNHLGGAREEIEVEGEAVVKIAGRDFQVKKEFIENTAGQLQKERLEKLSHPILIMHSPTDEIVDIEHAGKIFRAASHPKSFVALDGADHLLMDPAQAEYAATIITAWALKYAPELEEGKPPLPLDGTVEVETAGGKFAQFVSFREHRFIADEPKSYGGFDDGPTPYDLLLGALGTCTAMTMQMYARHKEFPLEGVSVTLEHSRNHHEDLRSDVDGQDKKVEVIDMHIEVAGAKLTDEQREKIVAIASKCLVHRTITGDLHIHKTS